MEILELEQKYSELQSFLEEPSSNRTKLLRFSEFFSLLFSYSNKNLTEAYLSYHFPKYLSLIKAIKIRGLNLEDLTFVRDQFIKVCELDFLTNYKSDLAEAHTILKKKYELMCSWLDGSNEDISRSIIYFPVLEKNIKDKVLGFLEILKVQVIDGENQFNIEPAESENDNQLQEQLHLCWENAVEYCKKHIKKIKKSHTVELKFENKLGVYIGNSLGTALTLAFIEAILKHYNSKTIVNINGCIAVTGGIDKDSKIVSTSRSIIETKVELVFFSDAHIFCVPKVDEIWAENKLAQLNAKYPNRKLKIIGLTDLDDLLSRRNIVDIHKRNIIERFVLYAYNKWKSILLAMVLTIIFIFLFALDFDTNPVMFKQNGKILSIQNKNGKTLWYVRMNFSGDDILQDRSNNCKKMIDINNDNVNEVIISEEDINLDKYNFGRVACFDNNKNLIWEYNFRDTVSTFRKWTNTYCISIIDTATISQRKVLLLMARNIPNFTNAVFAIDLVSGQRFDSTNCLWNAGSINNALSGDFNQDGKKEIILGGMSNGFERAVLFSVDLEKIKGQTPAPERYVLNNIPDAELNAFILLPHTDYGKLFLRSNIVQPNSMYYDSNSKEIVISTFDGDKRPINIYYGFDKKLNFLWVDCADNAQKYRDSIVAQHILKPPYTNTNEYSEILKNEIKYWTGNKFVSITEWNK